MAGQKTIAELEKQRVNHFLRGLSARESSDESLEDYLLKKAAHSLQSACSRPPKANPRPEQ